jgi:hypothetical protein
MAGTTKKKALINACCWVLEMVEMRSPKFRVVRMKRRETPKRRSRLPLIGKSKIAFPEQMIKVTSARPIRTKGIVLPRMSS